MTTANANIGLRGEGDTTIIFAEEGRVHQVVLDVHPLIRANREARAQYVAQQAKDWYAENGSPL